MRKSRCQSMTPAPNDLDLDAMPQTVIRRRATSVENAQQATYLSLSAPQKLAAPAGKIFISQESLTCHRHRKNNNNNQIKSNNYMIYRV